jgi:hypothetical protein
MLMNFLKKFLKFFEDSNVRHVDVSEDQVGFLLSGTIIGTFYALSEDFFLNDGILCFDNCNKVAFDNQVIYTADFNNLLKQENISYKKISKSKGSYQVVLGREDRLKLISSAPTSISLLKY